MEQNIDNTLNPCPHQSNTNYHIKSKYDYPLGSKIENIRNINKPHIKTKLGVINIQKGGVKIDKYDGIAFNVIQKYKGNEIIMQSNMECRKDINSIKSTLDHMLTIPDLNVILCIGGTGYSKSDKTIETLNSYDKVIPISHFGTYFIIIGERNHSVLLGRPSGFLLPYEYTKRKRIPVFCIPGHANSVETFCKHFLHNENILYHYSDDH